MAYDDLSERAARVAASVNAEVPAMLEELDKLVERRKRPRILRRNKETP